MSNSVHPSRERVSSIEEYKVVFPTRRPSEEKSSLSKFFSKVCEALSDIRTFFETLLNSCSLKKHFIAKVQQKQT